MTHNRSLSNKQKSRQRKKIESQNPVAKLLKGSLKALLISLLSAFLLLLISSAIALNTQNPGGAASPLGIAILIITSLICGFSTQKLTNSSPIRSGVSSSFVLSTVILVASLLFRKEIESFSAGARLLMLLFILLTSLLGAILGNVRFVKKRRSNHRRR